MSETTLSNQDKLIRIAIPIIPLIIAVAIIGILQLQPDTPRVGPPPSLNPVTVNSTEALSEALSQQDYEWPPSGPVPAIAIRNFPEGLGDVGVEERKSLFFRTLLPMILAENQQIASQRARVEEIHHDLQRQADAELSQADISLLEQLWERYRIEGDVRDAEAREQLLRRLDVIPPSLALAQAANESGWGTSRFTLQANNLFGEWTWDESIGLLPQRRAEGATHFVRVFPSLYHSIRSYIHNLNVGHAYVDLRSLRAEMRRRGQVADGLSLASGLIRYSERGEDYIREVQSMIRQNDLHTLPEDMELAPH